MSFAENLAKFREFLNVIRGKEDIREKFSFLFQPSNIKTASRLTISQAEFVADSYFVTEYFPEFKPLVNLAKEVAETAVSIKGARIEEAIRFQQASKGQPGTTQVGIFQGLKEKITKAKEAKEIEQ